MESEDQKRSALTPQMPLETSPRKDNSVNTPPDRKDDQQEKSSVMGQDREDVHCMAPGGSQPPLATEPANPSSP